MLGPGPLDRLALQDPERGELALRVDHLEHPAFADRADQLVLEIGDAGEEAELLQSTAVLDRAQTRALETAGEETLLRGVVQPGEAEPGVVSQVLDQEAPDVGGTAQLDDLDALGRQVATEPDGQRLHGGPVTRALDHEDGAPGRGRHGQSASPRSAMKPSRRRSGTSHITATTTNGTMPSNGSTKHSAMPSR